MTGVFRQFIIAVQFLTTIPIPGNYVHEEKDLGRSMIFYPIVGLLIGIVTSASYRLVSHFFIPAVSLAVVFVISILLTGGLHLDGFADMCDGFYAGKDKSGILSIMKDSHIGTMAVLGIFCLLLLKLVMMFSLLLKNSLIPAFLIVPVISRGLMALVAGLYPYARTDGTAKPFIENIGRMEMSGAAILVLAISYCVVGVAGIYVTLGTLVVAFVFLHCVKSKIGGITGDILGSVNEISEISALVMLHMVFPILKIRWIS